MATLTKHEEIATRLLAGLMSNSAAKYTSVEKLAGEAIKATEALIKQLAECDPDRVIIPGKNEQVVTIDTFIKQLGFGSTKLRAEFSEETLLSAIRTKLPLTQRGIHNVRILTNVTRDETPTTLDLALYEYMAQWANNHVFTLLITEQ